MALVAQPCRIRPTSEQSKDTEKMHYYRSTHPSEDPRNSSPPPLPPTPPPPPPLPPSSPPPSPTPPPGPRTARKEVRDGRRSSSGSPPRDHRESSCEGRKSSSGPYNDYNNSSGYVKDPRRPSPGFYNAPGFVKDLYSRTLKRYYEDQFNAYQGWHNVPYHYQDVRDYYNYEQKDPWFFPGWRPYYRFHRPGLGFYPKRRLSHSESYWSRSSEQEGKEAKGKEESKIQKPLTPKSANESNKQRFSNDPADPKTRGEKECPDGQEQREAGGEQGHPKAFQKSKTPETSTRNDPGGGLPNNSCQKKCSTELQLRSKTIGQTNKQPSPTSNKRGAAEGSTAVSGRLAANRCTGNPKVSGQDSEKRWNDSRMNDDAGEDSDYNVQDMDVTSSDDECTGEIVIHEFSKVKKPGAPVKRGDVALQQQNKLDSSLWQKSFSKRDSEEVVLADGLGVLETKPDRTEPITTGKWEIKSNENRLVNDSEHDSDIEKKYTRSAALPDKMSNTDDGKTDSSTEAPALRFLGSAKDPSKAGSKSSKLSNDEPGVSPRGAGHEKIRPNSGPACGQTAKLVVKQPTQQPSINCKENAECHADDSQNCQERGDVRNMQTSSAAGAKRGSMESVVNSESAMGSIRWTATKKAVTLSENVKRTMTSPKSEVKVGLLCTSTTTNESSTEEEGELKEDENENNASDLPRLRTLSEEEETCSDIEIMEVEVEICSSDISTTSCPLPENCSAPLEALEDRVFGVITAIRDDPQTPAATEAKTVQESSGHCAPEMLEMDEDTRSVEERHCASKMLMDYHSEMDEDTRSVEEGEILDSDSGSFLDVTTVTQDSTKENVPAPEDNSLAATERPTEKAEEQVAPGRSKLPDSLSIAISECGIDSDAIDQEESDTWWESDSVFVEEHTSSTNADVEVGSREHRSAEAAAPEVREAAAKNDTSGISFAVHRPNGYQREYQIRSGLHPPPMPINAYLVVAQSSSDSEKEDNVLLTNSVTNYDELHENGSNGRSLDVNGSETGSSLRILSYYSDITDDECQDVADSYSANSQTDNNDSSKIDGCNSYIASRSELEITKDDSETESAKDVILTGDEDKEVTFHVEDCELEPPNAEILNEFLRFVSAETTIDSKKKPVQDDAILLGADAVNRSARAGISMPVLDTSEGITKTSAKSCKRNHENKKWGENDSDMDWNVTKNRKTAPSRQLSGELEVESKPKRAKTKQYQLRSKARKPAVNMYGLRSKQQCVSQEDMEEDSSEDSGCDDETNAKDSADWNAHLQAVFDNPVPLEYRKRRKEWVRKQEENRSSSVDTSAGNVTTASPKMQEAEQMATTMVARLPEVDPVCGSSLAIETKIPEASHMTIRETTEKSKIPGAMPMTADAAAVLKIPEAGQTTREKITIKMRITETGQKIIIPTRTQPKYPEAVAQNPSPANAEQSRIPEKEQQMAGSSTAMVPKIPEAVQMSKDATTAQSKLSEDVQTTTGMAPAVSTTQAACTATTTQSIYAEAVRIAVSPTSPKSKLQAILPKTTVQSRLANALQTDASTTSPLSKNAEALWEVVSATKTQSNFPEGAQMTVGTPKAQEALPRIAEAIQMTNGATTTTSNIIGVRQLAISTTTAQAKMPDTVPMAISTTTAQAMMPDTVPMAISTTTARPWIPEVAHTTIGATAATTTQSNIPGVRQMATSATTAQSRFPEAVQMAVSVSTAHPRVPEVVRMNVSATNTQPRFPEVVRVLTSATPLQPYGSEVRQMTNGSAQTMPGNPELWQNAGGAAVIRQNHWEVVQTNNGPTRVLLRMPEAVPVTNRLTTDRSKPPEITPKPNGPASNEEKIINTDYTKQPQTCAISQPSQGEPMAVEKQLLNRETSIKSAYQLTINPNAERNHPILPMMNSVLSANPNVAPEGTVQTSPALEQTPQHRVQRDSDDDVCILKECPGNARQKNVVQLSSEQRQQPNYYLVQCPNVAGGNPNSVQPTTTSPRISPQYIIVAPPCNGQQQTVSSKVRKTTRQPGNAHPYRPRQPRPTAKAHVPAAPPPLMPIGRPRAGVMRPNAQRFPVPHIRDLVPGQPPYMASAQCSTQPQRPTNEQCPLQPPRMTNDQYPTNAVKHYPGTTVCYKPQTYVQTVNRVGQAMAMPSRTMANSVFQHTSVGQSVASTNIAPSVASIDGGRSIDVGRSIASMDGGRSVDVGRSIASMDGGRSIDVGRSIASMDGGRSIDVGRSVASMNSGRSIEVGRSVESINSGRSLDVGRSVALMNSGRSIDVGRSIASMDGGRSTDVGRSVASMDGGRSIDVGRSTASMDGGRSMDIGRSVSLMEAGRDYAFPDIHRSYALADVGRSHTLTDVGRSAGPMEVDRRFASMDGGRSAALMELGQNVVLVEVGRSAASRDVGRSIGSMDIGRNVGPMEDGRNAGPVDVGRNVGLMGIGRRVGPMDVGQWTLDNERNVVLVNVGRNARPVDVGRNVGPMDVGRNVGPIDVGRNVGPMGIGRNIGPIDVGRNVKPMDIGRNVGRNDSSMDVSRNVGLINVGKNVGPMYVDRNNGPMEVGRNVGPMDDRQRITPPRPRKQIAELQSFGRERVAPTVDEMDCLPQRVEMDAEVAATHNETPKKGQAREICESPVSEKRGINDQPIKTSMLTTASKPLDLTAKDKRADILLQLLRSNSANHQHQQQPNSERISPNSGQGTSPRIPNQAQIEHRQAQQQSAPPVILAPTCEYAKYFDMSHSTESESRDQPVPLWHQPQVDDNRAPPSSRSSGGGGGNIPEDLSSKFSKTHNQALDESGSSRLRELLKDKDAAERLQVLPQQQPKQPGETRGRSNSLVHAGSGGDPLSIDLRRASEPQRLTDPTPFLYDSNGVTQGSAQRPSPQSGFHLSRQVAQQPDGRTVTFSRPADWRPTSSGQSSVQSQASFQSQSSAQTQYGFQSQFIVHSQSGFQRQPNVESQCSIERQPNIESQSCVQRQPSVESQSSIQRQPSVESQSSVHRQPSFESQSSVHRQPSIESQSSVHRQHSVESQSSVHRQPSIESQSSVHRQHSVESQSSVHRQPSFESQSSVQRQPSIESQSSVHRQHSVESQSSVHRQPSFESQSSVQRQPSVESQTNFQRQPSVEGQSSVQRQPSFESQSSVQRQPSVESQTSVQRQPSVESQSSVHRQPSFESQSSVQRQPSVDSPSSIQRQPSIESQSSVKRQNTVESQSGIQSRSCFQNQPSVQSHYLVQSRSGFPLQSSPIEEPHWRSSEPCDEDASNRHVEKSFLDPSFFIMPSATDVSRPNCRVNGASGIVYPKPIRLNGTGVSRGMAMAAGTTPAEGVNMTENPIHSQHIYSQAHYQMLQQQRQREMQMASARYNSSLASGREHGLAARPMPTLAQIQPEVGRMQENVIEPREALPPQYYYSTAPRHSQHVSLPSTGIMTGIPHRNFQTEAPQDTGQAGENGYRGSILALPNKPVPMRISPGQQSAMPTQLAPDYYRYCQNVKLLTYPTEWCNRALPVSEDASRPSELPANYQMNLNSSKPCLPESMSVRAQIWHPFHPSS